MTIFAPGAEEAELAAAVEGCNQALGEQRCSAPRPVEQSAWAATILWSDAERRRAHVQLAPVGGRGEELVTREVTFGPDDPLEHRFRALGLILAAYLVASGASEEGVPSAQERPRAPSPTPSGGSPERDVARTVEPAWGLDALATLGSGMGREALALGGALRPWWALPGVPLRVLGQARWRTAEAAMDLRAQWMSGALGLTAVLPIPQTVLSLELRTEALIELVHVQATDQDSGRKEAASLLRFAPRAGAELTFRLAAPWALLVGSDAEYLGRPLRVDVAGQPAGAETSWALQGLVGLRFQGDPQP